MYFVCVKCYEFFKQEYQLNYLLATFPVPIVSWLNGITMGGGVGLSVHGKYRVATEKTVFAMPEVGIGFFPDVGGSFFLPRLKGHLGMYLALTGSQLKGSDVLRAGIATHFSFSDMEDEVVSEIENFFHSGMTFPNTSNEMVTKAVEQALEISCAASTQSNSNISTVLKMSGNNELLAPQSSIFKEENAHMLKEIESCFKGDSAQDIMNAVRIIATAETEAGLDKNAGWAIRALQAMERASPLALAVTHRQLQEGERLNDIGECLRMEYRIARQFMQYPAQGTFFEGVRAQLVDKDRSPKWKPETLDDVTEEMVDAFFKPLEDPADELVFLHEKVKQEASAVNQGANL